ncbi:catalytic activity protein [[Candida] boidinii]|nr:catalytic activity protein [[Candida] boidinii]
MRIKYILIPVATLGCGKTTVARILSTLYPKRWAQVQNDDIAIDKSVKGKGQKPKELVSRSLDMILGSENYDVVIIDKNNHMNRERDQLLKDIDEFLSVASIKQSLKNIQVKIILLNFITFELNENKENKDKLFQSTSKRVLDRGDNHQTIKVSVSKPWKVNMIMRGFINRFEPVDQTDKRYDSIINLDSVSEKSSLENAKKIIQFFKINYPSAIDGVPTDDEILQVFNSCLTVPNSPTDTNLLMTDKVTKTKKVTNNDILAMIKSSRTKKSKVEPDGKNKKQPSVKDLNSSKVTKHN